MILSPQQPRMWAESYRSRLKLLKRFLSACISSSESWWEEQKWEHAWSPCRKRQSSTQGHSLPACLLVLISDRVLTAERTMTDSETTNLPIHTFRTQSTWKANAIYKVQIYNWLDNTKGRVLNGPLHGTG